MTKKKRLNLCKMLGQRFLHVLNSHIRNSRI